ncbi:16S rRNA (cytidine(1402)-2'-O)-methyltransferase [Parasporobacterium paucivorans]|uniref:Ribosomal RNA small subunit methyltransferase I n=1 Tax=Parasporobacterium paucivorans DSM 15970 TaxID=1122934 RepID=A0A1M6L6G4_9FIRM|nr:16S rRNA (cytidine(1402)-2'-O)-methyltransferase [Parasporobacterium paucivorans]SHJ66649.1 16S rRNA (cytidine1402-2'-O)-methyltransferase [Parasporobacterium paucivorans DSM 15970]
MNGTLYLCATPIGNLEDITLRVLRILKEADLIAAEDTRHSIKLLNHFEIKTPMTSYHEFNKVSKARSLVDRLHEGMNIALITDAGTPGISDPGEELVRLCHEEGIPVTSLPGASACITALSGSGQKTGRFCFEAFLPSDKKLRSKILEELKTETRTVIFYEAPHRLEKTLQEILQVLGDRNISLCRELTKKFEQIERTTLAEAVDKYKNHEAKGEFVLVMEGRSFSEMEAEERKSWEEKTIEEHFQFYIEQNIEKKEAMKLVAKDRGIPKREVYNTLLEEKETESK